MTETVAVVIVHWNGAAVVGELLASLRAQSGVELEPCIIVDNASRPADRAELERACKQFGSAEIVWNAENLGFAGGANLGVQRAIALGARWVLLTTQDTVLAPEAAAALLQAASSAGREVIAGPIVLDRDTRRVLSAGERTSVWSLAWPRPAPIPRPANGRLWYPVPGLLGCTLFFSAVTWQRLGGFWEKLFAYYEEVDLALRARKLGIPLIIVPAARVYHRGWRGFRSGLTPISAELKARNLLLVFRRHARWYHYPLLSPLLCALLLGSVSIYAWRRDWQVMRALGRGFLTACRGQRGRP